ncbi:putative gustatory receptor 28b [Parasteatoda tepidariorum]|uniref:putative gustatory receptor 28b n=1 Tax=Parasteatoda tepidariorum TaxID=114398 RepID=UPI0039BC261E
MLAKNIELDNDFEHEKFIRESKEWSYAIYFLKMFGLFEVNGENELTTKARKCGYQKGIYYIWFSVSSYIVAFYIFSSFNMNNVADFSLEVVHNINLSWIIFLSFVLRSMVRKLLKAVCQVDRLRKYVGIKCTNKCSKTFYLLLVISTFILLAINIYRTFSRRNNNYVLSATFGLTGDGEFLSQSQRKALTITAKILMSTAYVFFDIIPSLSAIIIYLAQKENYRLIYACNLMVRSTIRTEITTRKLTKIIDRYSTITDAVKEVNDVLSSMIFLMCGFLLVSVCYSLSVMMKVKKEDVFRLLAYALCIAMYTCELIIVINSPVKAGKEMEEVKKRLSLRIELESSQKSESLTAANLLLVQSSFKRFIQDIAVVPMGMFKLEKKLFLSIIGLIVTYEIIILQFNSANL